jgi:hypothetical protein
MRRVLLALVVAGVAAIPANSAQAYEGPCAQQRALFEKYNIQLDMNAPLVGAVYNAACSATGATATGTSEPKVAVATRSTSVMDIVDDLIVCVREPCP